MLINVQEEYKEAIMQYRLEHLDAQLSMGSGDLQNYELMKIGRNGSIVNEQKQTLPEGGMCQTIFICGRPSIIGNG